MTFKSWSSAQNVPGKSNQGDGPKAAPKGDKPAAQSEKALIADDSRPAQKS